MFDTRLRLFDGVHHKIVERCRRCCNSNVVLLRDGPEVPKTTLRDTLGACTSRTSGAYMESTNATGAL